MGTGNHEVREIKEIQAAKNHLRKKQDEPVTVNHVIYYIAKSGEVNKIANYNYDEVLEKVGEKLDLVKEMLGVQREISDELSGKIFRFLRLHYYDLAPLEIEIAFDLALTDCLQVQKEHYQSFDIKYISQVLNAYRDYRKQVISQFMAKEQSQTENVKKLPSRSEITESAYSAAKHISNKYKEYLEQGEVRMTINLPFFYDKLDSLGYCKLEKETKYEIYYKAEERHKEEKETQKFKNTLRAALTQGSDDFAIKRKAKEIALEYVFEDLKNKGFTVEQFKNDLYNGLVKHLLNE